MKRLISYLFSMQFTAVLFIVFGVSMALATFIENDYGTVSARALVYDAAWFEAILALGMINIGGNILIQKLYRREKLTMFLFHLSFVLIILGAGITRYIGYEGTMHIREGETSNTIISEKTYILAEAISGNKTQTFEKRVTFTPVTSNKFKKEIYINDKKIKLETEEYIQNAVESIEPAPYDGVPVIELIFAGMNGRESVIMKSGDKRLVQGYVLSFNDTTVTDAIQITMEGIDLYIKSKFEIGVMSMAEQTNLVLGPDTLHPLEIRKLYNIDGNQLVLRDYYDKGHVTAKMVTDAGENVFYDAISLDITSGEITKNILLWGKNGYEGQKVNTTIDGVELSLSYGAKQIKTSFSIQLLDFILNRYPGSNSPSWFESEVVLIDKEKGIEENRRIFMNNVLKHRSFRFYQSSYDSDEGGTILSVNHDFVGTWVTYIGYILMGLGMFFSVFNKNSRFVKLSKLSEELRNTRKVTAITLLALLSILPTFSQGISIDKRAIIDSKHAEAFGKVLIQDNGGRIKPINTMSSEILRKVARKTSIQGLSSDQVFLGMLSNPSYWQTVPMIRVSNDELQDFLRINSKYASFEDFISKETGYILNDLVDEVYKKKPAYRNKFDTELIKVDERVNVCYMAYTAGLLKIFPKADDINQTWYTPLNAASAFTGADTIFVDKIIPLYFETLNRAIETGDYTQADEILNSIIVYQQKNGSDILPSGSKIKLETFYNNSSLFERLSSIYGLIGFILLILHFINIFVPNLKLDKVIGISSWLIIIAFVLHTMGLGIRWYISGHAPWSNGYEALVFIGWATILAGLVFSRNVKITLSVTAILVFVILHVAHLSWMDPQITNLVPVLKSYWLVIHVAVITASYGFLALGSLLAAVNLIIMFLKSEKNTKRLDLVIQELSNVIEKTLIVGLYMLTIGTFLGGVWANESWGRYWGWDPKETWALITVIVYAFIAHMRVIPGFRGVFAFNFMSLIGYSSVIMTYFGVNYYLSGLHSYAAGDPLPVPGFVYYTVSIIAVISVLAYINQKRTEKVYLKDS